MWRDVVDAGGLVAFILIFGGGRIILGRLGRASEPSTIVLYWAGAVAILMALIATSIPDAAVFTYVVLAWSLTLGAIGVWLILLYRGRI